MRLRFSDNCKLSTGNRKKIYPQPIEIMPDIDEKIANVSMSPGVYLMKDAKGLIIYVGKAANLKKRLSSYFKKQWQADAKTRALVEKIARFETIVTKTEKEALILESSLIRRHKPRYNIVLKDDKRYPWLRLDIKDSYPNLTVVRKTPDDGAFYFGPYTSVASARETFRIVKKTFKLRKCKTRSFKNRVRPCINFQMHSCFGPCCFQVDKKLYEEVVNEVKLFLKGRASDLIQRIKKDMFSASESQEYEKAANLRDKMVAIQKTLEKQVVATGDSQNRDVLGLARTPEASVITLVRIRGGYVSGTRNYTFTETLSDNGEMIAAFISQYYETAHFMPEQILVTDLTQDISLIKETLTNMNGRKVDILKPLRGEKAGILKMAVKNAEKHLKEHIASVENKARLVTRLKQQLRMSEIPVRIECFDNSNIAGSSPVAGMVVFQNGAPAKSSYRKYKIKTVSVPDDYKSMAEILKRRYGKGEKSKPFPDLLMVDGGKGQLNIAMSVLSELGLDHEFQVIGIAKKDEARGETQDKIYKPARANPVNISKDVLFFLQRIRDEAHGFAIAFHRKHRTKIAMRSELDTVPGIGPKRRTVLLRHFKSINRIREASLQEISDLPGMSLKAAQDVKSYLNLLTGS